jgi:hypothetical protein
VLGAYRRLGAGPRNFADHRHAVAKHRRHGAVRLAKLAIGLAPLAQLLPLVGAPAADAVARLGTGLTGSADLLEIGTVGAAFGANFSTGGSLNAVAAALGPLFAGLALFACLTLGGAVFALLLALGACLLAI